MSVGFAQTPSSHPDQTANPNQSGSSAQGQSGTTRRQSGSNTQGQTGSSAHDQQSGSTAQGQTGSHDRQSGSSAQRSGSAGHAMSNADQKFVKDAAVGGMAEVELGKLAQDKGSSEAVKNFGKRMVDDHSKANDELKSIASQKSIDLPTSMDAKHQATVDRLSKLSGAEFDRAYTNEMLKDHETDVKEFQKQSTSGSDPDLKNFASKTLPTLQEHLSMIRDISKNKSGTSADRSKQ